MNIKMKNTLMSIKQAIRNIINPEREYFEENGERIFVDFNKLESTNMDKYQKNHIKRYEFALTRLNPNDIVGDFACGTGYGSAILAKTAKHVTGADIDEKIVLAIQKKYKGIKNLSYLHMDLLKLSHSEEFDKIISFETIEHLEEDLINNIFNRFNKALKKGGQLIFSVPYMQIKSEQAILMGHHKTFDIDETKIESWLKANNFTLVEKFYQNYQDHNVQLHLDKKEFILCIATKG